MDDKEMIEITEKAVRKDKEVSMTDLLNQELAELQKSMTEEMERSCKDCMHYEICSLWATVDLDEDKAYKYCFGHYRPKIPKDAVVLAKMQYNALLSKQSTVISIDEQLKKEFEYELKQTRKETAEEYFNAVIEMLKEVKQFETIDIKDLIFLHEKNKEYAKQFDVEVEG